MKKKKWYVFLLLENDGYQWQHGSIETDNPLDALLDMTCRMLVLYPRLFFDPKKPTQIRKWIEKGKGPREHYFVECNGNVLSIMEAGYKCEE